MTPADRAFLVNIRSLLLRAVDLIDRRCELGKYRPSRPVIIGASDSIAGAVNVTEAVTSEAVSNPSV